MKQPEQLTRSPQLWYHSFVIRRLTVPFHVKIDGNEKANFLQRTAAEEEVSPTGSITFSELSFLKKIELNQLGRNLPSHLGTSV
ncbi:hypothetical protein TNCV_197831 [Trichonephila clavipes]|nr:hypothetical protein TNCV_197831 [Trichonephila clavipes]